MGRHESWISKVMSPDHEHADRALAIVSALLLSAAVFGHWTYGFYTLLRLAICAISIYLAVRANNAKSVPWTWVLGAMAVLLLHFADTDASW